MRPDAVIQGIGCLVMAATAIYVLSSLTFGSELLDLPPAAATSKVVLPLLLLVPCCVCCGCMMLWAGFGGQFPMASAGIRCDLPHYDRAV